MAWSRSNLDLCVPKTWSVLIQRRNRVTSRDHDRAALWSRQTLIFDITRANAGDSKRPSCPFINFVSMVLV